MTRRECENRLLDLLKEVHRVFRAYNPAGLGLVTVIGDDGDVCVFDTVHDESGKIIPGRHTVDATQFKDGHRSLWRF